jgi:hypothetical protein
MSFPLKLCLFAYGMIPWIVWWFVSELTPDLHARNALMASSWLLFTPLIAWTTAMIGFAAGRQCKGE